MAELKLTSDTPVLNELQKWLNHLFEEELCRNLQPDVHDIKYLQALKTQNEESEKNVAEEINLKETRIHYLNTKTEEMKTLLMSEDINLNEELWKKVESIAGLAVKMNIEVLSLTNFLLAVCDMKSKKVTNDEERMNICVLTSSYSQRNLIQMTSNNMLKSQLDSLKKVVDIQESNKMKIVENTNFFKAKSTEYECNVELFKDRLKNVSFEKSLQHINLVEWSKVIEGLEKKLKVSKEKLKNFKKLPPNEKLTKLKIKEKKEELAQLENEFSSLLEIWEKRNDIQDIAVQKL